MTNSIFQMEEGKIITALKKAGIMEIEMHGLTRVIPFLSNTMRKNETIFKAALGVLNKVDGIFVITSERVLFLHQVEKDVHSIEYDLEKVVSIDHKKEYPETVTIHTADHTAILENTRTPFGIDTFNLISSYLKSSKKKK